MRIIVTTKGTLELKDLNETIQKTLREKKLKSPQKITKSSMRKCSVRSIEDYDHTEIQPAFQDYIQIRTRKVGLPKNILSEYNKDIPTNLLESKINPNYNRTSSMPRLRSNIPLKDIIPKEAIKKLDIKLKNDKFFKKVDLVWRFNNKYREPIMTPDPSFELNQNLQKKLDTNKSELISYLKGKEEISNILINKIVNASRKDERRYNKICQKVTEKQKNDLKFKEELERRLIRQKTRLKENFLKSFSQLSDLNDESCLIVNRLNSKGHYTSTNFRSNDRIHKERQNCNP